MNRKEEAVVVSEAHAVTQRMLATLRESVLLTDADLDNGPRILYANDAFWTMTGYDPGELIGQTPRVLQGPKTDPKLLVRIRGCLESGEPFEGQGINYRKDGTTYHVSWYIEPIRSACGTAIEYYVGVQRDVTDRVQQEAALASVLSALRASPEGLVFLDRQGRVIRTNPAALEMLELREDDVLGKGLAQLLQGHHVDARDEGCWVVTIDAEFADAQRTIELRRIGRAGRDTFWTATDTTEKRRLEALANAINLVQQTGYVFAGIRHELGNPINSIKTALSVLQKHGDVFSWEKRAAYYARMLDEVDRIDFLLRSLRNYNAHESVEVETFELNEHICGFLRVADTGASDDVDVQWSPAQQDLLVRADPRGLYQVLLNLVKNAGDAVTGTLEPVISLSTRRRGDVAIVDVTDNGRGMSAQQLESIGRPFSTTKAKGTGLGLCVSQRVLASMDGILEFESTLGRGTTARILLPLEPTP